MYEAKKYDGRKELQECLKTLSHIPTNTEIVEKTGMSKGSISEIMNGKRIPTEKFVLAFKKGFKLLDKEALEVKSHQPTGEGLTLKEFNEYLLKENEFLKAMLLKK